MDSKSALLTYMGINGKLVMPAYFEHFEEPSAYAGKLLGYDQAGQCCYYQHVYTMTREVLDDEDNFYEEATFHEVLTAWMLDNGQWLCYRQRNDIGDCRKSSAAPRFELLQNRPR